MSSENIRNNYKIVFPLLILLWLIMIFIVNPEGNFPLNDDWCYAYSVKHLVQEGRWVFSRWHSMTLTAQVVWGAIFSKIFGFSFNVLRFSTLILGLVGVLTTYAILWEIGAGFTVSLLGALVVMTNPLYFVSSFTFMTEVPFYGCFVLGVFFFIQSLKTDKIFPVVLATIFSILAVLIRQVGLFIPIGYAAACLFRKKWTPANLLRAFGPTLLVTVCLFGNLLWLKSMGQFSNRYRGFYYLFHSVANNFSLNFIIRPGLQILVYLGFFLLPFLVYLFPGYLRTLSKRKYIFSMLMIFFLVLAGGWFFKKHRILPFFSNTMYNFGLGRLNLRDTHYLGLLRDNKILPERAGSHLSAKNNIFQTHLPPSLSRHYWRLLTGAGILGGALLAFYLAAGIFWTCPKDESLILCATFFLLYFFLLLFTGIFDRYLILFFPVILVIVSKISGFSRKGPGRTSLVLAGSMVLLFAFFSVAATHDYLSWNRARWQGLNYLMEDRHIPPGFIDGGYEFNGWYCYSPNYKPASARIRSFWWVEDDRYLVTFRKMLDCRVLAVYPFQRWLPYRKDNIFILEKNSPSEKK